MVAQDWPQQRLLSSSNLEYKQMNPSQLLRSPSETSRWTFLEATNHKVILGFSAYLPIVVISVVLQITLLSRAALAESDINDPGQLTVFRASILHFVEDPAASASPYEYFEDGILILREGRVEQVGPAAELLKTIPVGVSVKRFSNHLIVPGFIDTHIHYPQTDMIASYGEQLLAWLNKYTFPTENQFSSRRHADDVATFFLEELLRNGTTTALVFCTVHPQSVDALFARAQQLQMRLIAGKVLMDRNAPDYLLDTPKRAYDESKTLIQRWHNHGRLLYAITPRFAPTSSPEELEAAQRLKAEFPDVWIHTHLSENKKEVAWVAELFPKSKGYLDVYDGYGLLSSRSVFAHGIYLTDGEWKRLAETHSALSFCPTSNLFLGSGLFQLKHAQDVGVKVGIGTDVGAGTSFSILQTLNDAYKVMQIQGEKFSAIEGFYLATLGGARALDLDKMIGNFQKGKEADFLVLNWNSTPLIERRIQHAKTLEEKLFVLMMLGDDRSIDETYLMGRVVYARK
jgi:guanine deaminase